MLPRYSFIAGGERSWGSSWADLSEYAVQALWLERHILLDRADSTGETPSPQSYLTITQPYIWAKRKCTLAVQITR